MESIDKFLNKVDIAYCEISEPRDYGFGKGYGGFYDAMNYNHANKGNGIEGTDFYGKGNDFMEGYGNGHINSFNIVNDEDKGYGKPNIKD